MSAKTTVRTKPDIYQRITDEIVAAIETGAGPVEMPWHREGAFLTRPANALTAQSYQGVNILSLWAAARRRAFASELWATFNQWQCLGAQVRKGEKGSPIVFYKRYGVPHLSETGASAGDNEDTGTVRWFARGSWVFNAEQVDGWSPPAPAIRPPAKILAEVEEFVARTGAEIQFGGDSASYHAANDVIAMPARHTFTGTATSDSTQSYYAVLFHELTHWSGHRSRLNRDLVNRFGSEAYAIEELVAELGASFLCAETSIANRPRPDHACYIADWLNVLKNDKRAVFAAARKASESTAFLAALQEMDVKAALVHVEGGQE